MSKAINLQRLLEMGFSVPNFVRVPSSTPHHEVETMVHEKLDSSSLLAVRSSAATEDQKTESKAGMFHTELAISLDGLSHALEAVRNSLPREGANEIIVQEFIPADYSGVTFVDHHQKRVSINALPGLCRPVVDGWSSLQIDYTNGNLNLPEPKTLRCLFWSNGFEEREQLAEAREDQIREVINLCLSIAEAFDRPLDIEWSFHKGQLHILQARPITVSPWASSESAFYDSANVGESYGGIVSPLTASFARKLYSQVYIDLLRESGVSSKKLDQHKEVFDHLVNLAYGRLYYRMDNWYRMMAMLPGYERNKKNLENMLSLNVREEMDLRSLRPGIGLKLTYPWIVLFKFLNFGSRMRAFKKEVDNLLEDARDCPIENWDLKRCQDVLSSLFDGVLRKWYMTVENDTIMMTLYARLSKGDELNSGLLDFHSVSTEQVLALKALSEKLCSNPEMKRALENTNQDAFYEVLKNEADLREDYESYLSVYGGRFANELKLETADIENDFSKLSQLCLHYAKADFQFSKSVGKSNTWMEKVFKRFASRREVFRLLRANMFALVRKLVLRIADILQEQNTLKHASDVFYLDWDQLMDPDVHSVQAEIENRKSIESFHAGLKAPSHFAVVDGKWPEIETIDKNAFQWKGTGASPGLVQGSLLVTESFRIPEELNFDILVTERTDPGWTNLLALCKGLIVEHGGMLSHASIVARELGIPAVIGVENACAVLKTGQKVTIDGNSGSIHLMDH